MIDDSAGTSGSSGSAGVGATAGAGGSSGNAAQGGSAGTAGASAAGGAGGVAGAGGSAPAVHKPRVRVAQLVHDAQPVRFCTRPTGTVDFVETTFSTLTQIDPSSVTPYVELESGAYDLRLVPTDSPDCSGEPLALWSALTLDNDTASTLLASGTVDTGDAFLIKATHLFDQTEAPASGSNFRVVFGVPDTKPFRLTTFAGYSDTPPTPTGLRTIFPNVSPVTQIASESTSQLPHVDNLGYALDAWQSTPLALEIQYSNSTSAPSEVVLKNSLPTEGRSTTLFIGLGAPDMGHDIAAILCIDAAIDTNEVGSCAYVAYYISPSSAGSLEPGVLPAPNALLRVQHLTSSLSKPALILCARPATGDWEDDLTQKIPVEIGYAQQIQFPFSPNEIVLKYMPPSTTSCATPGPQIPITLESGTSWSVPLIQIDAGDGFTPVLVNHDKPLDSTQATVRVVNAVTGQTSLDLMVSNPADTLISGALLGSIAPGLIDGYASFLAPTSGTLALNTDADLGFDYITTSTVTLVNSASYSVWVLGDPSNEVTFPVKMLVCNDSISASSGESQCDTYTTSITP